MSEWTDDDGQPLGAWVEIDRDEWWGIVAAEGGLEELTVFSTLTDPDGRYGAPQIYTAWGLSGDDTPLLDIREYVEDPDREVTTRRKFVLRVAASAGKDRP